MSKLQKTYKYMGPTSKLMIFGSMGTGVWLYAEYLAHRESSNWVKHTWFANPNYHPNTALCWAMVITCVIGLFISRYRRPKVKPAKYFAYNSWVDIYSDSSSDLEVDQLGLFFLAIVSLVPVVGIIAWGLITWLIHFGSRNWQVFNPVSHSGGPIWYVSMWQIVVIGWSLVSFSWFAVKIYELETLPRPQSENTPLIVYGSKS